MQSQVGKMVAQKTRLAKGSHARPQLQGLQEWGDSLDKGQLVAVRVDQADRQLEGGFWLALTMGPAFPAPSHMALATDIFEKGWLIVPVCTQYICSHMLRVYSVYTRWICTCTHAHACACACTCTCRSSGTR